MGRQHRWTSALLDGPEGPIAIAGAIGMLWLASVIHSGRPLAYAHAVIVIGGAVAIWHWERNHLSRQERRLIAWWADVCHSCRIYNAPLIRLKTPGRLDARWSASSLTLQVEVHRSPLTRTGTPFDEKQGWVLLKSLEQLAGMAAELKMVMGHDVADVRVKPNRGNHATVIVVFHVEGARKVLVGVGAGGVGIEISVLVDRPNPAWVWHAAFGGYVLAKHRHAMEHVPAEGDGWNGQLDLDEVEDPDWWPSDVDGDPRSSTPLGSPRSPETDSDHEKSGCLGEEGRGEVSTPPWPAPNGPPYRVEAA